MSNDLQAMLAAVPDSYQKTIGFPTYDLLAAAALRTAETAGRLATAETKLNPEKLTGRELDGYIYPRTGQQRTAATYAVGAVTVTGNGVIQPGDLFESGGGIQFAATAAVSVAGSAVVPIRCTRAGSCGNLPAGAITLLPVQLTGIATVSNLDTVAEGYDAETDAAYYARFLLRLQTPPTSGNQYHYRAWALSVAGVGGVQIYPLGHGANTVDVVLVDTTGQPASPQLVQNVQTYIDPGSTGTGAGEAPLGAYCYVSAATAVPLALALTVKTLPGAEQSRVTQAIRDAATDYLRGIVFRTDAVSYVRLAAAILDAPGVLDYAGLTVNGSMGNIAIAVRQAAVLGEVAVTYAI
ncbi:MAG: baseplate J/gp47 family protein [Oscillospiraceae bacterium]